MQVSLKPNGKGSLLLIDVSMLVVAACGFLISLLTFIVLLIEENCKKIRTV